MEPKDLLKLFWIEPDHRPIARDQCRDDEFARQREQLCVCFRTLADVAIVELDGVLVQEIPNTAALLSSRRPRIAIQAVENYLFHVSLHSPLPPALVVPRVSHPSQRCTSTASSGSATPGTGLPACRTRQPADAHTRHM